MTSHLIHVAAQETRCTTIQTKQTLLVELLVDLLVRIPVETLHLFEEVWTLSGLFGRKETFSIEQL